MLPSISHSCWTRIDCAILAWSHWLVNDVHRLRGKIGISQEELGVRAGVHRTYISQIERGIQSPTLSVMLKLARALGMPAAKLVAAVENKAR